MQRRRVAVARERAALRPLLTAAVVVVAVVLLTAASPADAAGASITLRARWQGTPYLLEAAEFLADESPQLYWRFLEGLQLGGSAAALGSIGSSSSSACWHSIISQASELCIPQVAKILPVVVGVRQYSARLEMFRQLAKQLHPTEEHCCFVDVHGSTISEPDQLAAALKKAAGVKGRAANSSLLEADHVYNPDKQDAAGAVFAILHAAPGTECWQAWHAALKAAAADAPDTTPVVYVHRPVLAAACKDVHPCGSLGSEEQLVLPGYGVEAVLKNMEYSAMDDKSKADAAAAAAKAKKKAAAAAGGAAAGGAEDPLADIDVASLGEVKGFKFDVLATRRPELVQELMTFRDVLMSSDEDESIKVWDLKDPRPSLQAASRVAAASDPLALLAEISQNFLSLVSSLTRQKVSDRLRNTVKNNQALVNPGANFMLLNGMLVEVNNFELYSFLDRIRIELRLQGQLQGALGLGPGLVQKLLQQRSGGSAEAGDLRLDLAPMKQVLWLNNPEKDKEYAHLPGDLLHIINMFPGRLDPMAANLFSAAIIGDPLKAESVHMARILHKVKARLLPVRVGALLQVPAAIARAEAQRANPGQPVDMPTWKTMTSQERFARAFLSLKAAFNTKAAWDFWQRLAEEPAIATLTKAEPKAVEKLLKATFAEAWTAAAATAKSKKAKLAAKKKPAAAWTEVTSGSGCASEAGMQLAELSAYLSAKGLAHLPSPMYWLNGLLKPVPEGGSAAADSAIGFAIMLEMQGLQEGVYYGRIDDEQPVIESVLEAGQSVKRWNPRVLGTGDDPTAGDTEQLVLVGAVQRPAAKALTYLHSKGSENRVKPATHWVVADLANPRGRALVASAASYLLGDDEDLEPEASRTALLITPTGAPSVLDVAVAAALKVFASDPKLLQLLRGLATKHAGLAATPADKLTPEQAQQLVAEATEAGVKAPEGLKLQPAQVSEYVSQLANVTELVVQELQLPPGSCAVLTNGRLVWDFDPREPLSPPPALVAEDFGLLQLYADSLQTGNALATYLKSYRSAARSATKKAATDGGTNGSSASPQMQELSTAAASDVVFVTASALAAQVYPDSRFGSLHAKQIVEVLGSLQTYASVSVGPAVNDAELQLTAILNPLTREAQRLSQVLVLLKDVLNPSVKLYLNPQLELSELPLKSYYRYALPEFTRDEAGRIAMPGTPAAYFARLPQKRVLTLNLELPESWLVEPVMALHDLDNLRLADIPEQVVYAEYELDAIMLTGSCTELAPGRQVPPPKGLELQLGTATQPRMVDTLVMENLAYFQLKASPGLWQLSIAPGRSHDLYQIVSATSGSAVAGWGMRQPGAASKHAHGPVEAAPVLLQSFTGKHVLLKVQKRPGKDNEALLPAADAAAPAAGKKKKDYGTINVFTVASGHMYERLQKIMILSVIKNTKSKVKFWIISNYMSPHHKRIIPAMAAQYGFDYEFVTYKWPHWLHKQADKQRIIWAYKILFLDVLFPLDVPRMIFVDSDQVVRTDLAELYNMDLQGAPYAYTPFCDTNKETEPYRFWKQGFWEKHLGTKPYHISALYLIDLQRFRQLSAGDKLRVIYENLSKDPNSLANLDQDLPNYAQHQIPIFSLPQEWLWCESWCGNATKDKARTIDLCNNPKTKEPKLQAARRILPEWLGLDEEQAAFTTAEDAKHAAREQAFAAANAAAATAAGGGAGGGGAGGADADVADADAAVEALVDGAAPDGDAGTGDHSEL